MKMLRDVALGMQEGIFWGLTPEGEAVLVIVIGGERVRVTMAGVQAREVGGAGIYAGYCADQAAAQLQGPALASAREVAGVIVDAAGNPILTDIPKGRA